MANEKKIFVTDTSVIIYEHNNILNCDEHDVDITILEELDHFKQDFRQKTILPAKFKI